MRRTSVASLAVLALLVLPAMASATHTPYIDAVESTAAGCQVKGLIGFGGPKGSAAAPGLPAGNYAYVVTAVTTAGEVTPACRPQGVGVAGTAQNNSGILHWLATPGAVGYRIYRNGQALVFNAQGATTLPAAAICPPGGTGTGRFCTFQDNGGPTNPTQNPPASATPDPRGGGHPDFRIVERVDYGGSDNNTPAASTADDPFPADADGKRTSLEKNIFRFAPGLLANPRATQENGAVVKCKLYGPNSLLGSPDLFGSKDPNEDACPRSTLVGTVQTISRIPSPAGGTTVTLTPGEVYNAENKGSTEAARLWVVLRPACSPTHPVRPGSPTCQAVTGSATSEIEREYLSAVARLVQRPDGSYGIDIETVKAEDDKELPVSLAVLALNGDGSNFQRAGTIPLQVRQLTQDLFGVADQGTADPADDRSFMQLPTNCGDNKVVQVDASSHHDFQLKSASRSFSVTDCDKLPFTPEISATVGGPNQNGLNQSPQFTLSVAQDEGEAAISRTVINLPPQLSANLAGLQVLCTEAQLAAGQCPNGSNVGTVTAKSPLVDGDLSGLVYLIQQPGGELPKLALLLNGGGISLRLNVSFEIGPNGLINTLDGIPDVPLSAFTLAIRGGTGGLLLNAADLCAGAGALLATFTGHNGAVVQRAMTLPVLNQLTCPVKPPTIVRPTATVSISKVRTGRPTLVLTVRPGTARRAAQVRLTLPRGMRFDRRRRARNVRLNNKSLSTRRYRMTTRTITLTNPPTGTLRLTLKGGVIRVTSATLRRRPRARRLTFPVRVVTSAYGITNLRPRALPRS